MKKGFTLIELLVVIAIICIIFGFIGSLIFKKQKTTNTNIETVVKSVEVPKLVSSSERANVAERAKRFDDPNKISYVYFLSYGKVMAFYTAKGKVSSLNSYMTPEEKLVNYEGKNCGWSSENCYVMSAPDVDGTYGKNIEGIFFFTTDGAYVEWKGDYMMSDQPLKLTTQPELIRVVK